MVFNITPDDIRVRMSAVDESIFAPPPQKQKQRPDLSKVVPMSDFVRAGAEDFPDVVQEIYDEINAKYGTSVPYPQGGGR